MSDKTTSKYARTTITNPYGTITTARINMLTGEIKPHQYGKPTVPLVRPAPKHDVQVITDYSAPGNLLDYIPPLGT